MVTCFYRDIFVLLIVEYTAKMENMTQNSTPSIPEANTIANITLLAISLVLCVIGLTGNIATIVIIKFKDSFYSVTYTTIGLLAFVDTVAICFRSIVLVVLFHFSQWFDWGMPQDSITGLLVGAFYNIPVLVCPCSNSCSTSI